MPATSFYEKREDTVFTGEMTHFPFPLHVHEVVEIVIIRKGSVTMQIGQEIRELHAGDCAAVFPFIPHSYDTVSEDLQGFAAIFPPDTIVEFSHEFRRMMPINPIFSLKSDNNQILRLLDLYDEIPEEEMDAYRKAFLHMLLALLIKKLKLTTINSGAGQGQISRILQFIADHALEPISLKSIAAGLEINEFYLSHIISEQLKTSLRGLINSIRISYAIGLMRDPEMSLTQISEKCGYTNIQTFRKAFRDNTGMLPTEYLQNQHPFREE